MEAECNVRVWARCRCFSPRAQARMRLGILSDHGTYLNASWLWLLLSHQHADGEQAQPGNLICRKSGTWLDVEVDLNSGQSSWALVRWGVCLHPVLSVLD